MLSVAVRPERRAQGPGGVIDLTEGVTLYTPPDSSARPAPRTTPSWVPKLGVIGADVVAIVVAMTLALALRTRLPGNDPTTHSGAHLLAGLLSIPVWLAIFAHYRLYSVRFLTSRLEEYRRVVHAVGAAVIATAVVAFLFQWPIARGWLVITFFIAATTVTIERNLLRRHFDRLRSSGRMVRRVVIVGANGDGMALQDQLEDQPWLGYWVVGVVDPSVGAGSSGSGRRAGGELVERTRRAVAETGASSVVVVSSAVDWDKSSRLVRELTEAGFHVELTSSVRDIAAERLTVRPLGRFPVVYVEPVRRNGWRAVAKRGFDIVASAGALLVLSPVLVIIGIAIKLGSRGPVLFHQERVGIHGHRFRLHKFRTMVTDADAAALGAQPPQRGRRPALQDPRRPAHHPGRTRAPSLLDRRAPAALERAARRDEPGRSAARRSPTKSTRGRPRCISGSR